MKGIVFTEFLDLVEDRFGLELADRVIRLASVGNNGAYTSVGTYDHAELLRMVVALSEQTGVPVPALVKVFGKHFFHRLAALYPRYFQQVDSVFTLLPHVERVIHLEVRKLHPTAELPAFEFRSRADGALEVEYRSSRPFADLAEGLILAAAEHFHETIELGREDLPGVPGCQARFTLVRVPQLAAVT